MCTEDVRSKARRVAHGRDEERGEGWRNRETGTIVIFPARDSARRKSEGAEGRRRGIVRSSRWERTARRVDRRCKEARASPVSAHGYRRWRAGVALLTKREERRRKSEKWKGGKGNPSRR